MAGNLKDYEPVEERIRRFYEDHPQGRICTTLLESSDSHYIVQAAVYREGEDVPAATGLAGETVGSTQVNRTHPLENCETSAIGRALANLNYAPKGTRPSREEMEKAGVQGPPDEVSPPPASAGPSCPTCGFVVWDNRGDDPALKRPAFKCKKQSCQWTTWDREFFTPRRSDGSRVGTDYDILDGESDDPGRPF